MPYKSRTKTNKGASGRTSGALRRARMEGLTLLVADNPAGYFGVHIDNTSNPCKGASATRRR